MIFLISVHFSRFLPLIIMHVVNIPYRTKTPHLIADLISLLIKSLIGLNLLHIVISFLRSGRFIPINWNLGLLLIFISLGLIIPIIRILNLSVRQGNHIIYFNFSLLLKLMIFKGQWSSIIICLGTLSKLMRFSSETMLLDLHGFSIMTSFNMISAQRTFFSNLKFIMVVILAMI